MTSLDHAEPAEQVYRRLRAHPWLADAALALLLLGSVGAFARQAAVIPVAAALAGAVMVRRRFPVAALVATLAIGTAQVIVGITPAVTGSPLQLTFADTGILVLLYTVAAGRPRRVSLAGLAACVVLFVVAVARLNPGSVLSEHPREYVAALMTYALMPICAWVLGNSMAHRRAYLTALEERAVRAEAERDAQAQIAAAAERARIARELHDVIAHNLSVMVAQADGGRYAFDAEPERSRQVLILTTFDLDEYAYAALRAGASGFLLKSVPPEELLYAIRCVHNGDSIVAPSITRRLIGRFLPHLPETGEPPPDLADLTAREREVLAQAGCGLSNTEIAGLLTISETTVKTHIGHIMAKLGLRDRIQIVVYAYETGLVTPQGRPGKDRNRKLV